MVNEPNILHDQTGSFPNFCCTLKMMCLRKEMKQITCLQSHKPTRMHTGHSQITRQQSSYNSNPDSNMHNWILTGCKNDIFIYFYFLRVNYWFNVHLIWWAYWSFVSIQWRGLRMLSLVLGSEITDASVAAISSSYPNLELLDLSGYVSILTVIKFYRSL